MTKDAREAIARFAVVLEITRRTCAEVAAAKAAAKAVRGR